jgi:hypothetical protein
MAAPASFRFLRTCHVLLALGCALALGRAWAQDAALDTPFDTPRYLVHHSGRGTTGGFQPLDYYSLEPTAPQGPTMQTPGGDGTTFTDNVELTGGPFATRRQVCDFVQGTAIATQISIGCPAPPPPAPVAEQPAPVETAPPAPVAEQPAPSTGVPAPPVLGGSAPDPTPTEPAPPSVQAPRAEKKGFSEWWDGLSTLGRFVVIAGVLILLKALANALGLTSVKFKVRGKVSHFGGPNDLPDKNGKGGVKANEGLALVEPSEMESISEYFLPEQPPGTTGLARRLNPDMPYVACRWDYKKTPRDMLRGSMVKVTNVKTGKAVYAKPVDWGPNEDTGRAVDVSPGLERQLGVSTDDVVEVILEK